MNARCSKSFTHRAAVAAVASLLLVACGSSPDGVAEIDHGSGAEASSESPPGTAAPVAPTTSLAPPLTTLLPVAPGTTVVPPPIEPDGSGISVTPATVTEPCPTSAEFESADIDEMVAESSRLEPMLGQVMGYLAENPDLAGTSGMVWHGPGDASVFVSFVGDLETHRVNLRDGVLHPDELIVCQTALNQEASRQLEAQLLSELAGRFVSIGRGANGLEVALAPGELELADELDARYGDAITLKVGALDFPLNGATNVCPEPKPMRQLDGLTIEIVPPNGPLVSTGLDPAQVSVQLTNVGDATIDFTSGIATGTLLDVDGRIVNIDVLGVPLVAVPVMLEPGESTEIEMLVSTASCDPALGAELPPGDYQLVVNVPMGADGDLTSPPITITIGD